MEIFSTTVEGLSKPIKIRDYLKRLGFSTSLIAIVKFDMVYLNGITVHMREPVKNGDLITVHFPPEESEAILPLDLPLDVLYEDEYILVVNKPKNMPIHPSRGNHLPTLANVVRHYIDHPFVFRCITRLDRDTSGIVLIAKDRLSSAKLSEAMKAGKIVKKYLARVEGTPFPEAGIVDAPIMREAEGEMKRVVRAGGKYSRTAYETLSIDEGGNALLLVSPLTGRTHQIRVHMSYIGHPLVGDFLYGERIEGETYRLHCTYLSFSHPISGKSIEINCKNTDI